MNTLVRALCTCTLGVLVSATVHAAEYRGPDVLGVAGATVNVLKMHQHAMNAQLLVDDTPFFFELAARSSPGTFVRNDGFANDGGLTRYGISMGGGLGQPSDFGVFAGLQFDLVSLSQFPNFFATNKNFDSAGVAQALLYAGVAVSGVQLTYGVFGDALPTGFDAAGNFATPNDTTQGEYEAERQVHQFVTLQPVRGFSVGAAILKDDDGGKKLGAIRATLQPVQLFEALELEKLGVPTLGIERYAAGVDYYGDRFETAAAEQPDSFTKDMYEVPLSLSDIFGTGLNARVSIEVAPTPSLRVAEAGWMYRAPGVIVEDVLSDFAAGFRALMFKRGDGYKPSADVYIAMNPDWYKFFSMFGVPWLALSYSYNSPDSATFLPLPDTHVIGFQIVYGPVEMARPLLPIMPSARDLVGHDG
jgi:hypothetical protein